jgi:GNAT superfamily N-acetyltransferase
VTALLETMVSGFADDPLYTWLYPAADERPARLREGFESILAAGLQRGHVYTNAGRSAVAVWTAPGVELMDESEAAPFLGLVRRQIGDRVEDVIAGMSATVANRPREPHFTLHNVVVRRDAQGRGVGAALLEPILARCDEDRLPACLDSSNSRNVPFYERLGFEVTGETRGTGDAPVMRSMLRAPR